MIPVLLTIRKETLIEDYTKVVLVRQRISEVVILSPTIGTLTENLGKQTLSTKMMRLLDVTLMGLFTIGKILVQICMNINKIQNMIRKSK